MRSRGVPESGSPAVLYYVHDPMCSWCYAFAPVWENVSHALKTTVLIRTVLGGLAPDTKSPMPTDMQSRIKSTWKTITNVVPGTEFNHDFWTLCTPRRSTYPACRAIIAAREQGADLEPKMIAAIQSAYYREARNPSLPETLIDLAGEIALDTKRFGVFLAGEDCENTLQEEVRHAITLGIRGFPTLMLHKNNVFMHIQHDYNNAEITYRRIKEGLDALELQLPAGKVE
jgi:putative protein-disulfide isomerase